MVIIQELASPYLHNNRHQFHRALSVMNVFVLGLWVCFTPTEHFIYVQTHTLSLMYSCCLPHKLMCSLGLPIAVCFWGTQRDRQGKVKGSNHGVRGVVNSPLMRVWHAWFVEGGDGVDWSPGMGLVWVCFCMSHVKGCAYGNKCACTFEGGCTV